MLAGIFVIIFLRFYYLQIYQHSKYEAKAGNNSIRKISLHAPRGIIYDRNGIPIVDNRQIYDLAVIPFDVTSQFDYQMVSKRTGVSSSELQEKIAKGKKSFHRFRPVPIKPVSYTHLRAHET